jgi:hypothetical protein
MFITSATYEITVPNRVSALYDQSYTIKTAASAPSTVIASHISLDGLGVPDPKRRFTAYPVTDGGIDTGFRMQPRQLTWTMFLSEATEAAFDAARDQLCRVFLPYDRPHVLKITTPAGSTRWLDVYVNGPIDLEQRNQEGYTAVARIPLYAPNPIFYSTTLNTHTITPVSSPATSSIMYAGTWHSWPIIKLTGQLTNAVLALRVVNGAGDWYYYVDFSGHTIPAGDVYTIDLTPGVKTAKNSAGASVLSYCANIGSLAQWRLWAYPVVELTYTAKSAAAKAEVLYYNRYIAL